MSRVTKLCNASSQTLKGPGDSILLLFPSSQAVLRSSEGSRAFLLVWRPELRSASTLRLLHAQRRFLAYVLLEAKLRYRRLGSTAISG